MAQSRRGSSRSSPEKRRFVCSCVDPKTPHLIGWFIHFLIQPFIGSLICWFTGPLILDSWLVDSLVWFVFYFDFDFGFDLIDLADLIWFELAAWFGLIWFIWFCVVFWFDWLTDCLIGWLIGWLIWLSWLTWMGLIFVIDLLLFCFVLFCFDWLTGWLVDWLIDYITVSLPTGLFGWSGELWFVWLVGWLIDWMVGCLSNSLPSWLFGRFVDWLGGWLKDWCVDGLTDWGNLCLIIWLICWLIGWLIGR